MIIVTTMMHMNRAMRPIMTARRIGIMPSLLDDVSIEFPCSVDVGTLLEVYVVVDLGVSSSCSSEIATSSSGFVDVLGSSNLCGDELVSFFDTVGSLDDKLQVLSWGGVHM